MTHDHTYAAHAKLKRTLFAMRSELSITTRDGSAIVVVDVGANVDGK